MSLSRKLSYQGDGLLNQIEQAKSLRPAISRPTAEMFKPDRKKAGLTALSLFSGGGGLDLGFSAAGVRIRCSNDIDVHSCKTLELNSGKRSFYNHARSIPHDIREITAAELLQRANLRAEEIDIVLGGPPCQAFSIFGQRKGLGDPRGNLVWEYLRVIQEIKPRAFVFENVAGLKSIHDGQLYQQIIDELSLCGYTVSPHEYQVADYGIPQFRERIFFIGSRDGHYVPPMMPTHGDLLGMRPHRTAREALKFLDEPDASQIVPNHIGRDHSERIVERYTGLKFGERDPKTRINKLHPERPSFTIIVGSDKGGGKGHVHPFTPREVTPRESARMQTFPDWWEFYGTGRHVIRQVGNAVPPLFAALLAEHVKAYLFGARKKKTYDELVEILELNYLRK